MTTTHTNAATGDSQPERLLHEKPIALRMLPTEREEVIAAARSENRSASNFALMIFRSGFSDYKARLGVLHSPTDQ